jgi:DNA (cytosine-5)-methyltransferase 1
MQGFPAWFKFPETVSESAAMKQLGNSVAVPAIRAYANAIFKALE